MKNRIREFRKAKGMTLQEVADACGLSRGYLSKVERADTYPPFSTLQTLAKVLGIELEQFFRKEGATTAAGNIELAEKPGGEYVASDDGYAYEPLLKSYKNKYMAPFRMRVPPGRTRAYSHDAEEFVYVLKGSVTLEYEGREYSLAKDSTFYLDSRIPHVFVNNGDRDAELLAVNFTYKRF